MVEAKDACCGGMHEVKIIWSVIALLVCEVVHTTIHIEEECVCN